MASSRWPVEADPLAQVVGGEVERRWHCSSDGLGRRVCRGGLPRPGEALWGSSCTDSAWMKEFTVWVSTAAFAAAASGVPGELCATWMGKSGV